LGTGTTFQRKGTRKRRQIYENASQVLKEGKNSNFGGKISLLPKILRFNDKLTIAEVTF